MHIQTDQPMEACQQALKDALDSRKIFKAERYTGWVKGRFFSMAYTCDKEAAERGRWSYNKAMGFLTEKNGCTHVHMTIFRGLSDPVSLLILFVVFLVLFLLIQERWHATFLDSLTFSLLAAACIACISYMATAFGEVGRQETETLRRHIQQALDPKGQTEET